MTTKNIPDCSTAGKGFARTEGTEIASESCGLPERGFATTNVVAEDVPTEATTVVDCSTAGMGFARTEKTNIASESCAFPTKGFGTTDFGK